MKDNNIYKIENWLPLIVAMLWIATFAFAEDHCEDYKTGVKQLYWGDLHVHTSFSFDAYGAGTRNDPFEAYAFAKGKTLELAGGIERTIDRTLDFAAVTDHAEQFALMNACTFPQPKNTRYCEFLRENKDYCKKHPFICRNFGKPVWQRIQLATNKANKQCDFTAFNAYEWSLIPIFNIGNYGPMPYMMHRNVIFASEDVTEYPVDSEAYPSVSQLWRGLEQQCESDNGCEAMTIPHNSNYSFGHMFNIEEEELPVRKLRAKYEKLVEIFQGKGNSECLYPYQDDNNPDCAFEIAMGKRGQVSTDEEFWEGLRSSYVRPTLKRGLKAYTDSGLEKLNPLQLGFVGSTDTHNATPGAVEEDNFNGHHGVSDVTPEARSGSGNNPGGLVAVWAEENTRASLFAAMKRRETYATSGPRITVRFYQTWDSGDPCANGGEPSSSDISMGGKMVPRTAVPRFVVNASMDKTRLARIDIIKASYDVDGNIIEKVYHRFADDSVNGDTTLCRVFRDTNYDPSQAAFWYARVLERPTPRWSYYDCLATPGCRPLPREHLIQERAWASPIWNLPE